MNDEARVPNPGSAEAILIGCECAVIDNHHGKGFMTNAHGEPLFWINDGCVIHGRAARSPQDDAR